jgi:hypothetical protein
MAFTGIDSVVTSITGGKSLFMGFNRTIDTGATSVAGRWHSCLTVGGTGGAMTLTGTAGTGIVMSGSTGGRLPVGPDVSTDLKHLVTLLGTTPAATAVPATLMLTDILHIYPSCALTGTPSTLSNHPTWTGTGNTRMTAAGGVQCSLLVTTATSAGNGQITPTYFDQDGNSTAAPSSLYAVSTTHPTGCFYASANAAVTLGSPFMSLAAGDYGVQRVVSYVVNTGATSGVGCFILHRPIATIPLAAVNTPSERSFISDPFTLPRVYDDSCLGLMINVGGALTASQTLAGTFGVAWG